MGDSTSEPKNHSHLVADAFHLPNADKNSAPNDILGLSRVGCVTCRRVPLARWDVDAIDVSRFNTDAR